MFDYYSLMLCSQDKNLIRQILARVWDLECGKLKENTVYLNEILQYFLD
jgi:hypothetical protein